ncbi:hypothetical protein BgiBS90_009924 [Biomphalaria glabrata]|nr:hypothetical protein BgiBS90_009924 [Biomphalaria glabrata]
MVIRRVTTKYVLADMSCPVRNLTLRFQPEIDKRQDQIYCEHYARQFDPPSPRVGPEVTVSAKSLAFKSRVIIINLLLPLDHGGVRFRCVLIALVSRTKAKDSNVQTRVLSTVVDL